jgi:cytidylate kinase
VVAIDGPSASGKTTIGRMLARHLSLPLVDSGLMYRAVATLAHDAGIAAADEAALARLARDASIEVNAGAEERAAWEVRAQGRDLTARVFDPAITPLLTRVSQVRGVREELVQQQRRLGANGVVMIGRDIGTVVFPDADLKLFTTASLEERKRRRAHQTRRDDHAFLKGEIEDRDVADSERSESPLYRAEDAYTIDTDGRSPDDVFQEVLRLIPPSKKRRDATAPEES